MNEILGFIKSNFFNVASLLVGVIGIILAVIFYFKTRKVKLPVYILRSFNLFNSELKKTENIEIKYLGENIKNLTASKFIFWNGGRATIDKSDIPESSKLTIKTKGNVVIYGAEVIFSTNESNRISIDRTFNKNEIVVNFEYLDRYQGAIVKILHSGESSNDLEISGIVKGVGNFQVSEDDPNQEPLAIKIIMAIFTVATILGGILSNKLGWKISLIILGAVFTISLFSTLGQVNLPKELRKKYTE